MPFYIAILLIVAITLFITTIVSIIYDNTDNEGDDLIVSMRTKILMIISFIVAFTVSILSYILHH